MDVGHAAVIGTVAVVDRDDLAMLRMWGRDPVRMLNGLLTNDLGHATTDRAVYAAILTPKGKVIADVRVFHLPTPEGETELRLAVPAAAVPTLGEHLRKYVPPHFAKWEFVDGSIVGVYGPRAAPLVTTALGVEPATVEDAVTTIDQGGRAVSAIATRITGVPGYDLFFPAVPRDPAGPAGAPSAADATDVADGLNPDRAALSAAARDAGGGDATFEAFEIARVEAGRPRYGVDITDATLPAEAFEAIGQMDRAISFSKGCYTGQEVVIRIAHRGHVNRHLRGILLGDVAPPAPGSPLVHPETGKQVGFTTSAVVSPALGRAIALGYVRREVEPGDEVTIDARAATVTELPFIHRGG